MDMTTSHEPIVCTLPADQLQGQTLEWTELHKDVIRTESLATGLAMTFDIGLADAIEDLAVRESQCCAFLTITTTRGDTELRLEITSDDPAALPVIELLAGTAKV